MSMPRTARPTVGSAGSERNTRTTTATGPSTPSSIIPVRLLHSENSASDESHERPSNSNSMRDHRVISFVDEPTSPPLESVPLQIEVQSNSDSNSNFACTSLEKDHHWEGVICPQSVAADAVDDAAADTAEEFPLHFTTFGTNPLFEAQDALDSPRSLHHWEGVVCPEAIVANTESNSSPISLPSLPQLIPPLFSNIGIPATYSSSTGASGTNLTNGRFPNAAMLAAATAAPSNTTAVPHSTSLAVAALTACKTARLNSGKMLLTIPERSNNNVATFGTTAFAASASAAAATDTSSWSSITDSMPFTESSHTISSKGTGIISNGDTNTNMMSANTGSTNNTTTERASSMENAHPSTTTWDLDVPATADSYRTPPPTTATAPIVEAAAVTTATAMTGEARLVDFPRTLNGDVIDAKNTLHSYSHLATDPQQTLTAVMYIEDAPSTDHRSVLTRSTVDNHGVSSRENATHAHSHHLDSPDTILASELLPPEDGSNQLLVDHDERSPSTISLVSPSPSTTLAGNNGNNGNRDEQHTQQNDQQLLELCRLALGEPMDCKNTLQSLSFIAALADTATGGSSSTSPPERLAQPAGRFVAVHAINEMDDADNNGHHVEIVELEQLESCDRDQDKTEVGNSHNSIPGKHTMESTSRSLAQVDAVNDGGVAHDSSVAAQQQQQREQQTSASPTRLPTASTEVFAEALVLGSAAVSTPTDLPIQSIMPDTVELPSSGRQSGGVNFGDRSQSNHSNDDVESGPLPHPRTLFESSAPEATAAPPPPPPPMQWPPKRRIIQLCCILGCMAFLLVAILLVAYGMLHWIIDLETTGRPLPVNNESVGTSTEATANKETVGTSTEAPANNETAGTSTEAPHPSPFVLDLEQDRSDAIVAYINQVRLSNVSIPAPSLDASLSGAWLRNTSDSFLDGFAEELALEWLILWDPLQLWPGETPYEDFRLRQRYAVATIFAQTDASHLFLNEKARDDECTWSSGITCTWVDLGPDLGSQHSVTEIKLDRIQWGSGNVSSGGTFPVDLGLLSTLRLLSLHDNGLVGTLPMLDRLTDLQHFNVSSNNLRGTLPTNTIQRWTQLESFDVNDNAFTGSLPSAMGLWTGLTSFDVSNNDLIGPLPESVGAWTDLLSIDVASNRLTGTLPAVAMSNWTRLERAYFHYNLFVGHVPDTICAVASSLNNLEADCLEKLACQCCTVCT